MHALLGFSSSLTVVGLVLQASGEGSRTLLFRFEGAIPRSEAVSHDPAGAQRLRGPLRVSTSLENSIASTSIFDSPSYKEPTVDALAPDADEGRGWLRKATGSCRPSFDPWMSEWGNPAPVMGCHPGLNT